MKSFTRIMIIMLVFCLSFGSSQMFGQNSRSDKIIVTQKIETEDGQIIVKKKALDSPEDVEAFISQIKESVATEQLDAQLKGIKIQHEGEEDAFFYFKERANHGEMQEGMHAEKMKVKKSKTLLGIYPSNTIEGKGVRISSVVKGKGAEAAGLLGGDIVTNIAGNQIQSVGGLRTVLDQFEPGQSVSVSIERDGQVMQRDVVLSEQVYYRYYEKRDPCKVFIGIFSTSSGQEDGVRITDVIPNTSADKFGLQKGDILLMVDGITVNSHHEVVTERDKHEAGDWYEMTLDRNGKIFTVKAQFNECEQEEDVEEAKEELQEEETESIDNPAGTENGQLVLDEFSAYPNPTVSDLNVSFKGEAVPTQVRITDINGRVVFEEFLPNFDGVYQKLVSLGNVSPGNLNLSVYQKGKVVSKSILLLNRA
ncbi:MAG: PDZ domain-containing protein [Saprospiraceae bacterium]|nr:PDZ domain-containing protein [Saprospiraceae bacterium]